MANIISGIMGKLDPERRRKQGSFEAAPPHYVIEHAGWESFGWSEDDPTADDVIAALASLSEVNFSSAMEGLRKSGETSLKKLEKGVLREDH